METIYYGVTNMAGSDSEGRRHMGGFRVPMEFVTSDDANAYAAMMGAYHIAFSSNRP